MQTTVEKGSTGAKQRPGKSESRRERKVSWTRGGCRHHAREPFSPSFVHTHVSYITGNLLLGCRRNRSETVEVSVEVEEEDDEARQASYDKREQFRLRESCIGRNSDVESVRTRIMPCSTTQFNRPRAR